MTKTVRFDPKKDQAIFDNLIKYAIAPRPICFASTVNKTGDVNLSPFSYFNFMSHQPPICVFSPMRRMRDGSTKHTLDNILETGEVVINVVNYDIVQQQSLASTEYGPGVDEFKKSGLTPLPSLLVAPPRVAESPVQLECRVQRVIPLSELPGAGNLVLAEILCMHVHEHLLAADNTIQQHELNLVARLGGNWYCRVTEDNLFLVPKPLRNLGIGVDQLPESIRNSRVLTGNHLGMLANVEVLPQPDLTSNRDAASEGGSITELHRQAARLLDAGDIQQAWQVLLQSL